MNDAWVAGTTQRRRARGLGIAFDGVPGPVNAITDVPGVEVGYETLIAGDDVRTGVTAICPLGRERADEVVPAGWYSLNGNGEMTGTTWIEESGGCSLPICITNTHAVGAVHRGVIEWAVAHAPDLAPRWLLPVVGETWDGYLNDINGPHVGPVSAGRAIDAARGGALLEGSVGGGTGMNCYGFKGGNGTASRVVAIGDRRYTVGVLLQANFGSRSELVVRGVPVGRSMLEDNPLEDGDWLGPPGAGSCIAVVATDAPLLPGQCKALGRRVPLGLARTGTSGSHFSGDIFLTFSTANAGALHSGLGLAPGPVRTFSFLGPGDVDPLYEAVVQCVEEATLNALAAAETMLGRDGHRSPGLPVDRLMELLGADAGSAAAAR